MELKDASVTIWMDDGYEDTQFSVTYRKADGLTMCQYINACRRAAIAYGFSIDLVDKYLPEIEPEF